jgi:competence protein ComGC
MLKINVNEIAPKLGILLLLFVIFFVIGDVLLLLLFLRNFVKQRCAVEKSYGEAMQKISANYLNKKMPPIHEISCSSDGSNNQQQWYIHYTYIVFCVAQ